MSRFACLLLLLILAAPAAAHPIPNTRYDRTIAVRIAADKVTVKYTLEVSQFTIFLDGAKLFSPEEIAKLDRTSRGFAAAYGKKMAPELARDLHAWADGKVLEFRVESIDVEGADHPRFQFLFKADWPPGGKKRALDFKDATFEDKTGLLALTLDRASIDSGVSLDDVVEPDPRWREKPAIDLTLDQAAQLRKASAVVTLPREIAGAETPPSPGSPVVKVADTERPHLLADLWQRGLPALFDHNLGVGILLLAAFLFGSFHAFTPGHGKTLVAAYLVGERGTIGHALILAIATTVAHTGSVIIVATVLYSAYGNEVPGSTQGVLQFAGGILVAAVGLWLLLRRLTGQADHFHLFAGHHHHGDGHVHHHHGDHDHHHHHEPLPESAKSTAGWTRLILMGLGGGIIPCWDAVLLLLAAAALNRVGFAIPLLFSFSAGLGAVLVLLGVSVVYAHKKGAMRFSESRWFKVLPMVSALLLLGVGLWLCREGLQAVH